MLHMVEYATDIAFEDTCDAIVQLMDSLVENRNKKSIEEDKKWCEGNEKL